MRERSVSSVPRYFFNALAAYKNERAAQILSNIVKYLPTLKPFELDTAYYKDGLYEAICDNACEAYSQLITIVEPIVEHTYRNRIYLDVDTSGVKLPVEEENKEKFSWYY